MLPQPASLKAGSTKSGECKLGDLVALWVTAMLNLRSQSSTQDDLLSRPVKPKSVQAQGWPSLVVLVAQQDPRTACHSDALDVPEAHAGVCC